MPCFPKRLMQERVTLRYCAYSAWLIKLEIQRSARAAFQELVEDRSPEVQGANVISNTLPSEDPAYSLFGSRGSTAKERISAVVSPEFISLQLAPPSVLLNTSPPFVPTYNGLGSCGTIASASTVFPSGPMLVHSLVPDQTVSVPRMASNAIHTSFRLACPLFSQKDSTAGFIGSNPPNDRILSKHFNYNHPKYPQKRLFIGNFFVSRPRGLFAQLLSLQPHFSSCVPAVLQ